MPRAAIRFPQGRYRYLSAGHGCFYRLLAKMSIQKQMAGIVRQFVNHVVPGVLRPLRILWNEIIGFFFLVFGAWFGSAAIRGYRNLDKPGGSMLGLLGPALAALIMFSYGIHSFLKARKIGRS
jgi:hypothetical protein